MRKFTVATLLLALIMIFAGCNLVQVNEERDSQTTVIKVDGQEITKAEYAIVADQTIADFRNTYSTAQEYFESAEGAKEIQALITKNAIEQKLLVIKAEEYGCYDFNQEELDSIQGEYNNIIDRYKALSKSIIEGDDANAGLSQEELDDLAEKDYQQTLQNFNIDEEVFMQQIKDQTAVEKLIDIITETEAPTESDIQTEYASLVTEYQNYFITNLTDFESAITEGATMYYNVVNMRKTRHILIALPDDVKTEINNLRVEGDDAAADLLLKEELAKIKDSADAVYTLAIEGADFDELITEYGEDPGMVDDTYYTVISDAQSFVPEFVEGLYSLNNVGDFTQPISSDFGYHIILYAEEIPEGPVAIEDVRDDIIDIITNQKANNLYYAQIEEWEDAAKVKVYDSRIDIDLN